MKTRALTNETTFLGWTGVILIAIGMVMLSAIFAGAQNIFPSTGSAGIGTTTPNASAVLDVASTTKGVLFPRMTKDQRDAIVSPVQGLIIYQTNNTPGLYYYDGGWAAVAPKNASKTLNNLTAPTAVNVDLLPGTNNTTNLGSSTLKWKDVYVYNLHFNDGTSMSTAAGSGGSSQWTTSGTNIYYNTGNVGINTSTPVYKLDVNGDINIASGFSLYSGGSKLISLPGTGNVFLGPSSGGNANTGNNSTALGNSALAANTAGYNNTASGYHALFANTTGSSNSAFGTNALSSNQGGVQNTAIGSGALFSSVSGTANTIVGYQAAYLTNGGTGNNTVIGYEAMYQNVTGGNNTAIGMNALLNNNADYNTAVGIMAGGVFNTQGYNTCVGAYTGNGFYCTNGTLLGYSANANANGYTNITAIGYNALSTGSNQVRIGNSSVTSIGGYANWTNISDGRVKTNIRDNVPGLEFISKLKPVTYNLNLEAADEILQPQLTSERQKMSAEEISARAEKEKVVYSGFIAQDVESAAKELGYDFSGVDAAKNDHDLYGLRYSDFVVPLVKSIQELSAKNDAKDEDIKELKQDVNDLLAMVASSSKSDKSSSDVELGGASLEQNSPNPFSERTTIHCYVPSSSKEATLRISTMGGNEVKSFSLRNSGMNEIEISGGSLTAGDYIYELIIDGKKIDSKKMTLTR